jgi:predicted nucleic acid-binding protein
VRAALLDTGPVVAFVSRDDVRWAWESAVTVLGASEADHSRTAEILNKHIDQRLSYVDALLLAIAERYAVEEVLTVDGSHFPAVRLNHVPLITVV